MNKDLVTYYHQRAQEYDKIYARPERQESIGAISSQIEELFVGKEVLEVACGTGYWTEVISAKAKSVLATDINEAVLDIARNRDYKYRNVEFKNMDIFHITDSNKHESLFGGFIWSHILREHLNTFLKNVQNAVCEGGLIVLTDNIFVEDSSTPIVETDEIGNTYQLRALEDSSQHMVLKNFYTEEQLRQLLEPYGTNFEYFDHKYYWVVSCENKFNE